MRENTTLAPLTLSLSQWERGRPLNGCDACPLSHGERAGVRGVAHFVDRQFQALTEQNEHQRRLR